MKIILEKIIAYLLLTTIIVFPLSIKIALLPPKDLIHPIIALNLSFADILIGLAFSLWFFKVIFYKELKQIKLPPISILIFAGIGALSFVNALSMTEWVKELVQIIEYFIVFYLLLLNNLQKIKILTIINILFSLTTFILLLALLQHTVLNGSPYLIRGLFENRNIMGLFLCMVIPLAYASFLYSTSVFRKAWILALLFLSLIVMTSGSAIFSLTLSLFVVSFLHSTKTSLKYAFVLVLLTPIYFYIFPQKNINSVKEFVNIYEQGNINENYYRIQTILYDVKKPILLTKNTGANSLVISNNVFIPSILPEIRKGEIYKNLIGKKLLKNRYMEMQAALNMISDNTLIGVGLGNFQTNIGTYYRELPKVNTAEPNQHNGYLIMGSTAGILGLAALLWILVLSLKNNYLSFKNEKDPHELFIYSGLFGSLLACMIENNFSYLFSASLIVPLILIIFLSIDKTTGKKEPMVNS
jgi:hypothetical protein